MSNKVYSYEEKLNVVNEVLENGMSIKEAGRKFGIHHEVIRRWVRMFEYHGHEGLKSIKKNYTGEFKQYVLEYRRENNLSLIETSFVFGINSDSTLREWEKIYNEVGIEGLYREDLRMVKNMSKDKSKKTIEINKTEAELIAENKRLQAENAYLKKLMALVQEKEKSQKKTK